MPEITKPASVRCIAFPGKAATFRLLRNDWPGPFAACFSGDLSFFWHKKPMRALSIRFLYGLHFDKKCFILIIFLIFVLK
ncbi:MAG: hypothetical protein IPN20_01030 [Haliscomenobacter sp.]|nr:hypothetical protein [Haliscomenobacter sp.]